LVKITSVLQTANFKRAVKKLHQNQKKDLDKAVKELIDAPLLASGTSELMRLLNQQR
jgi:spore germination protein GerM